MQIHGEIQYSRIFLVGPPDVVIAVVHRMYQDSRNCSLCCRPGISDTSGKGDVIIPILQTIKMRLRITGCMICPRSYSWSQGCDSNPGLSLKLVSFPGMAPSTHLQCQRPELSHLMTPVHKAEQSTENPGTPTTSTLSLTTETQQRGALLSLSP